MPKKTIQGEYTRECRIDPVVNEENDRQVELAFSSEAPVERWFGTEVLDHSEKSVRLGRLNDGAAVLVGHDDRDHVGVVERAWIDDDRKARAVVRFSKSQRGEEILQDVKDGIRTMVSVGYQIHKYEEERGKSKTVRAVDWEPHEISIVSIPADSSVGVGRQKQLLEEGNIMPEEIKKEPVVEQRSAPEPKVDVEAERNAVRTAELDRINQIEAMADEHGLNELGRKYIAEGRDAATFYKAALDEVGKRNKQIMVDKPTDDGIGLTQREQQNFSLTRLMYAQMDRNNSSAQNAAAFELDVCSTAAAKLGINARGTYIPSEILSRDLSAGTATDGAELVADNLLAGSFIELLRNNMAVIQAGATVLPGLVGDVSIPRQTAGAAGGWISSEGGAGSETEAQFDQVTLSPKDVITYTDVTRRLLLQSTPAIEGLVRRDLATAIALTCDLAALDGSGASGQPTGVSATSGINVLDLAAADPTWAEVVEIVKLVMEDNSLMGNLGWIIESNGWEALMTTDKASGVAQFILNENSNTIVGHPYQVSEQVTAEEYFFGNWSDLLIGEWGGLEILADPYTASNTGTVRYNVYKTVDIAVRHATSFCHAHDGIS